MMKVPFLDLARLHASIRAELDAAFDDVVTGSRFVGSAAAEGFETDFAAENDAVHDRDDRLARVVAAVVTHLRGPGSMTERAQVLHAIPAVAAQLFGLESGLGHVGRSLRGGRGRGAAGASRVGPMISPAFRPTASANSHRLCSASLPEPSA